MEPIVFYNEEIWKPITRRSVPDIFDENTYLISSHGRAYSRLTGKYLTPVQTANGYTRICLKKNNGDRRYYLVHRIMMIEFCPVDDYQNKIINHLDSVRSHNVLWNLEWTDQSGNIKYAFQTGSKRQYHGEECSFATITNVQAEQIAQLIASQKYTQLEISDITGVKKHIIGNISVGSTWVNVYNKYQLWQYKKPVHKIPDEKVHEMCRYIMSHLSEWNDPNITKNRFFTKMLFELYGEDFNQNLSGTYSRIFTTKQTRRDITSQYNF